MINRTILTVVFLLLSYTAVAQKDTLIPYKKGKLWGFATPQGEIVITPVYDTVYFFDNGMARVRKAKLEGMISTTGKPIVPIVYSSCEPDDFGINVNDRIVVKRHFKVSKSGKLGIIDQNGVVKVPFAYSEINWESPIFAYAKKGSLYGVIKREGENYRLILPVQYSGINHLFEEEVFQCTHAKGVELRSEQGKLLSQLPEVEVFSTKDSGFEESYIDYQFHVVNKNGKVGLVRNGQNGDIPILPAVYDSILNGNRLGYHSFIVVKKDGKWGAVTLKNEILLPFDYEAVSYEFATTTGFMDKAFMKQFWVKQDGKWGLVGAKTLKDLDFSTLLPCAYDSAMEYGRDYLILKNETLFYVFNLATRKMVTNIGFANVSPDFVYSQTSRILFWVTNEKGVEFLLDENGRMYYQPN